MLRRTKIIATIGPASSKYKILEEMVAAGMNLARINFSHGNKKEYIEIIKMLREISLKCDSHIGIIADLQGPKIRIKSFQNDMIFLNNSKSFFLDSSLAESAGSEVGVGVDYENMPQDLSLGDSILLDDGRIKLRVEKIEGTRINTIVECGGELSNHKGINLPASTGLSITAITKKDRQDILLAAELNIDFLAISFVKDKSDIEEVRRLYELAGGQGRIIAKIERAQAYNNLDELIEATDVVMVARGDLGTEIGFAELTGIQKEVIRKTRRRNKPVITATEMMQSMINSPLPTRAEVSDVSNAVMDGTDAVMLSAETAIGVNPVAVISSMSEVICGAEKYNLPKGKSAYRIDNAFKTIDESIAMAAMYTANHYSVVAIIALTESGSTPLWMSRIRSEIPIFALTAHNFSGRRVTLYRGVYPLSLTVNERSLSDEFIFDLILDKGFAQEGDSIILTRGSEDGLSGGTNSMRILKVQRSIK